MIDERVPNLILWSVAELDRTCIETWATRLHTMDVWEEILRALPTQ
jgi:hypothetical protein